MTRPTARLTRHLRAAGLGLLLAGVAVVPAMAGVILRAASDVGSAQVRLSDLFDGLAPETGSLIAFPAPAPGESMTINARQLDGMARRAEIAWQPSTGTEEVTITRRGQRIPREQIDALITDALDRAPGAGMADEYRLDYTGRVPEVIVAEGLEVMPRLADFIYDPRSERFSARIEVDQGEGLAPLVVVAAGRATAVVSVPVLRERLARGAIIGPGDIDLIEVERRRLTNQQVTDPNQLIGQALRRPGYPGRPLMARDVGTPQLIRKGEMVTMIFRRGGLVLTAQGQALDDGGEGETVRVLNPRSRNTVYGRVAPDGTLEVGDAGPSLARN
ncbi:flagellar basal body P-ring formation chaperone FlgA [Tistrella mobilis]|uniref:flagellar basal body P-ring formation chaperone FlgA n=1 Tax=Tistrella mobilis TaxID=171437 RepID=UPI003557CAB5